MTVKIGQAWAGLFVTLDATGAKATPSVGPAGVLYVNGVADAASVTITGSNPYKFAVTLPSLSAGDRVSMYITATISGIATASVVAEEQADTSLVSDVATTATAIKAKTDNLPADPADDSDIDGQLATIASYIDTEVGAIKGITDKLDTAMELDGAVYRFTTNALEQAPSGGSSSGGGGGGFLGGSERDWSSSEREQIRQALGISGKKTPTTGDGNLDLIMAKDTPRAGPAVQDNSQIEARLAAIADYLHTDTSAIQAAIEAAAMALLSIKAKTDKLPETPAAAGDAMNLVDGAITAQKIADNAIDAPALTADAVAEIWAGFGGTGLTSMLTRVIERALEEATVELTPRMSIKPKERRADTD